LHARLATDAAVPVEVHDTVVAAEQSRHRANRYARSVFAVIASEHRKEPASVGEFALLDVLYPRPKGTKRNFVLRFARNCARVAADAFAMIYDEAVFHLLSV